MNPTFAVVPLPNRAALLPERYPRFTMIGQALGSVRMAYVGLTQMVPEVSSLLDPGRSSRVGSQPSPPLSPL